MSEANYPRNDAATARTRSYVENSNVQMRESEKTKREKELIQAKDDFIRTSLFVTSLIIGVVCLIVGGVGSRLSSRGTSTNNNSFPSTFEGDPYTSSMAKVYDTEADERHTLIPQSQWNKFIKASIKSHYPTEGMTKEELMLAVGKPKSSIPFPKTASKGEYWSYEVSTKGDCLKYDGEPCSEHKTIVKKSGFHFTPKGYLTSTYLVLDNDLFGINSCSEPFSSYRQSVEIVLDAKTKLKRGH